MGSLVKSGLLSSVAQAVPSSTTQPMPIDPMEAMYINTFGFNPFPKYGFNSYMDYNTARTTGTPMNQNISDLEDYLGTLESAREINLPGVTKDLSAEDISRLQDEYVKKMASTYNALNPTVTASTPTTKPDYRQQALSEMLSRYNVGSLSDIKNFNYLLPGYKDKNNLNVRTFETRDPLLAVDRRAQQLENAAARTSVNMQGYRPGAMDGGIISTRVGYRDAGMVSPTDSDEEGIGGVIYQDEDGNIISKKEAMKLFKKQAEEEAEERENKFEGGRIGYRDAGYVGERKDSLKGGGYDSTLSFNPLEDDINSLLEDGGASAGIVSAMLRRNSGAMTAAGETAKKGLNKSTIELTKKESKYLKELIGDTGGGKFKAEILEEVPSLLVKNNKLTVKQRDLNSLSKYLDDVYLSELAPSGRGANLMPPRLRSSATSDKSVIGKLFRESKSMGGLMGLKMGGMPSMEMDYRGGGFIPVGAKERADDVPARLSKNEFVMTADAVRAAGGGSVDEGARRMYQLMDALEGRRT
jgi:hypothetical protein